MKRKICFIVSSPATARAFLDNHFENLHSKYGLYLVANFAESNSTAYSSLHLTGIKHIAILRKIDIVKDVKAFIKLSAYLKEEKFDLIITFTPKAGLIGILAAYCAGIKKRIHFFTGQVWHTKRGFYKKLLMLLDKVVVWGATEIIVDGKPQQRYLEENKIIGEDKSVVLGRGTISGIDLDKFSPDVKTRDVLRARLNYKDTDIVFMFLGRINVDKGVLELVNAFNELERNYNNVKMLIVGPVENDLAGVSISKLSNRENICYFGPTSNPEQLMQACDVFCLPSHREAFGLSIIEASACEKPIICSDTYGLQDTIVEGRTGLKHVTADSESILMRMVELLQNPRLRLEMGINGRRFVTEHFSRAKITKLWVDYLGGLIS